jgi:enamine deaminase RidA (YjgF/YER057c/UK114 family)
MLTEQVAGNFADIAQNLRKRGHDPVKVAHFVNQLVFCMFAEDVGLLPKAADFPAAWPALREAFGNVRPAATMQECGLADPRMRIEIEVDAIVGSAG